MMFAVCVPGAGVGAEAVPQEISHRNVFLHGSESYRDAVFVLVGRILKCRVCTEKMVRQSGPRQSTV